MRRLLAFLIRLLILFSIAILTTFALFLQLLLQIEEFLMDQLDAAHTWCSKFERPDRKEP